MIAIVLPVGIAISSGLIRAGVGYKGATEEEFVLLSRLSVYTFGGCGLIVGLVSGFYAPAREPLWPMKSRFFKTVGIQTFAFWLPSNLVTLPVLAFALNSSAVSGLNLGIVKFYSLLAFSLVHHARRAPQS